jgi:hypothetical protein
MMANKSISDKKWEEVKTYFITNTAELIKGSSQSLRSMASRFGVNTSALIRKADALDENNNTWWELRENFKKKYSQTSEKQELVEIKLRTTLSNKMLTNLKIQGYEQLKRRINNDTFKISTRDWIEIVKLQKVIDSEMIPQLISSAISVNLKIDKPIASMDEIELEALQKRIDKFSIGEIEDGSFEVISDE